jgi:hypothetical protein
MTPLKIAILLSTCDSYWPIACLTRDKIHQFWKDHPPIYVAGISQVKGRDYLPFSGDPRNWVQVTFEAARALKERGFQYLFLILDDHPPLGRCHTRYMNNLLPSEATKLGAVHVNLIGWDQFQPWQGEYLGEPHLYFMRNHIDFKWKFSLHPSLWDVKSLCLILERLLVDFPEVSTARAFEGRAERAGMLVEKEIQKKTFRICGDRYAVGHRWFEQRTKRRMATFLLHACRWSTRLWGGEETLSRLDHESSIYIKYLNGPYPMYWSGLMQQGRPHEDALHFLTKTGQGELATQVRNLSRGINIW